jgi:predicted TIM-barrel fold metal-dependent hydrolase
MSVNNNSEQIASLGTRVSSLVDELHSVKKEIELFKKAVAADMKVVLNHVGRNK